ncbi:MAG: hypothetical protein R3C40_10155 [Parvularculaceae bacterium]
MRAVKAVMEHFLQLLFQQLFNLMRVVEVHQDRTDGVADDLDRILVEAILGYREKILDSFGFSMCSSTLTALSRARRSSSNIRHRTSL